jgi:glycosyltransferase involved in cell wall biosynthesis
MRATLIEPCSEGRISGGFLYNTRIARSEPAIARLAVRPERLAADLAEALVGAPRGWLVADSLFLDERQLAAFQRWRSAGHRLALLLHAFPSFVRRAEDREALARCLPLLPTDEELELLASVDLLIAPGPYAPRLLAERSRVATAICPPGVDRAPAPGPRRCPGAGPVELISIGSVTPLKGLLDAVEALGQLRAADFRWTIVGHLGVAPEHVAALQRRIAELDLVSRVVLAGQRDHAETLASLRSSDLLLLTSFTENHPLVALEALRAGIPVVGYAVGGLPDIVRHGEHGLLAPLLDVSALASCIADLLGDPAWRRRLAESCTRAADELPTWEQAARHFVETLAAQPL